MDPYYDDGAARSEPCVELQVVDDTGDLETAVDPAAGRMKLDRSDVRGSRDSCMELASDLIPETCCLTATRHWWADTPEQLGACCRNEWANAPEYAT